MHAHRETSMVCVACGRNMCAGMRMSMLDRHRGPRHPSLNPNLGALSAKRPDPTLQTLNSQP